MSSKAWMHSQQTIRPRTRGRVPLFLCVTLALLTALVVYRWGYERWLPVRAKPTFTATVQVAEKSEEAATFGTGVKPFSHMDADPERARKAARALGEEYVAEQRRQWQVEMNKPLAEVRRQVELAHQRREECVARLDAFKQQIQSETKNVVAEKPSKKMIANPRWLELEQESRRLIERREEMLSIRTHQHPDVIEVSNQIVEIERGMAAIPRMIPFSDEAAEKDAALNPVAEKQARENRIKLNALYAAVSEAEESIVAAEQAEDDAAQRLRSPPEFAIKAAGVVENLPDYDPAWRRLMWTTLAAGLMMAFGAGTLSFGSSVEPPISSINEVRAATKKTVVGTIPAVDPAASKAEIARQWHVRRTTIALGLLLMAACPAAAVWGVLGI